MKTTSALIHPSLPRGCVSAPQHSFSAALRRAAAWIVLCLGATAFAAEPLPPRTPSPVTVKQIHSGHSLSDAYGSNPWPGRLILATEHIRGSDPHKTIHRSIIPGSPLSWRWNHASSSPDARKDIGKFELLVTTQSVPFSPDPEYLRKDCLEWFDKWVGHAWKNGNGGKGSEVMLYSSWTYWQHSGEPPKYDKEHDVPFRERLERDGQRWELMQDTANQNRPKGMPLIYMIPGHRLMMRIYDDITAKKAPGLKSIGDLFSDDIHVNDLGQYAVTCLVYAVIYQRDPKELPDKLAKKEDTLSPAQAKYFKKTAWEVATNYPRSGVPTK